MNAPSVVEIPRAPTPAPPMTVPVLVRAMLTGCGIGALVLAIDAVAPGRIGPFAGYVDPAAAILVGIPRLPLMALGLSIVMNAVFYGMLAMIALVTMTFAGVRAHFKGQHWLVLGSLMTGMMVAFRLVSLRP